MDEKFESKFKEIAARYCSVNAEDIKDLEDEFDVEFNFGEDETKLNRVTTVESAMELLQEYIEE